MTHFYLIGLRFLPKTLLSLFFVAYFFIVSSTFANQVDTQIQVLRLAVASNLRFSMDEVATAFEKVSGLKLQISYGASGNLMAQIIAGAPFDLFFSADEAMPKRLIEKGFGERAHYFIYGTGRIVLWLPHNSSIDLETLGMDALLHDDVNQIAIANPRHAPYGFAAIASLKYRGFFDRLEKKLVTGENISHAAMFVRRGGAEIGMLSYALALAEPLQKSGRYWLIPDTYHPPLHQAGLILTRSQHQAEAKKLIRFIQSGAGLDILKKYGFFLEEGLP